ncbi:MAG: hypothetical protein ACREQN_13625 [Candidatus Binataceae bacterium]
MRPAAITSHGQIIVVVAIAISTIIAAVSLAGDVAVFYFNWMQIQKAADSSVLAGASHLPLDSVGASATAAQYATVNGIRGTDTVATVVSSDGMRISMTITRPVSYFFARVVGLTRGMVSARAAALLEPLATVNSPVPIGIDSRTAYSYGQQIQLMYGQYGAGNWGALDFNGGGAGSFANYLQNGYDGRINGGSWISTETGMMVGPTRRAFESRVSAGQAADPSGTFASHTINDPRVVTVAMVNYANVNGSSQVQVMGFAELWLVGMDNNETITTYFIRQVGNGTPSAAAANYGGYQPVLVN